MAYSLWIYLLRWITADYKFGTTGWTAFVKHPFRLISVMACLSVFALAYSLFGWTLDLRIAEMLAVGGLAVGYILISAIVIFHVEPHSFRTFFDAVYWATVSLTTVGYGDIYPVTMVRRAVAMLSSFFGIAVVAVPAGIITAEYMHSLKEKKD